MRATCLLLIGLLLCGATNSGRFKTAKERLPEGLPNWFLEKMDEFGEVPMCNFTKEWTDEKAIEFALYDLNDDGIITPKECLKVEKMKKIRTKQISSLFSS